MPFRRATSRVSTHTFLDSNSARENMRTLFVKSRRRVFLFAAGVVVITVIWLGSRRLAFESTFITDDPRRDMPARITSTRPNLQESSRSATTDWLAITSVCVDEGENRAPDGQKNTARNYMHITMANHAAYATAHGYPYVPLTNAFPGMRGKDVRFHKLGWVRQLLDNYTWVFYTDCDSLFADFCVDVGQALKRFERGSDGQKMADIILTGDKGWAMNSGQFIIRNTDWSKELLHKASLEPRNTHGCVGNDNAAFNWLLWRDCSFAKGDFTTWWDDTHRCRQAVQRSLYADKLACAPLNTYSQHIGEARRRGPVFRLHFAGSQKKKMRLIQRYVKSVNENTRSCDTDSSLMNIQTTFD